MSLHKEVLPNLAYCQHCQKKAGAVLLVHQWQQSGAASIRWIDNFIPFQGLEQSRPLWGRLFTSP